MAAAPSGFRSERVPEEIFATQAPLSPDKHATSKAVAVMYKRGDPVWYRQRDGTDVPAKVVAVDMAVYPPSYGVQIGNNIRETEAVRLRTRGEELASHTALQAQNATHSHTTSYSPYALRQQDLHPVSSTDGDFDDFQGPSDAPQYSHRQPVSDFGNLNATGTAQHAQQTFAADWDHHSAMHNPHQMSSLQHDIRNVSPAHPHPPTPGHVHGQVYAHNEAAQPHSKNCTAFGVVDDADDDGFGDFAEAPPSAQRSDAAQQSIPPVSDRSAPLSMTLFGEESYEDQEPPSMQLGPVWAPSWVSTAATSSPSASGNDARLPSAVASQMAGPVQSQQSSSTLNPGEETYQQQQPQQWLDASPTAAANTAMQITGAASPLGNSWVGMAQQEHAELTEPAETASDFGSFTAGSPTGYSPTMPPGLTVPASHPFAQHTASEHKTAPADSVLSPTDRMHAFSQAPNADWTHNMEESPKKAASVPSDSSRAYRQGSMEVRPAAAAAHDSVLQSMNRSVPISLDAFGAEDVPDAELDLPSQPDTTVTPPFQGQSQAASGTPFPASPLQSAVQSHTAVASDQHGHADWDASEWQGGDIALPAVPGFSATWPVARASAEPNQQQSEADERFSASGPVVFEAFAAENDFYPNSTLDSAAQQMPSSPPGLSASGPISLELFGMEEQEDEPLSFSVQASLTVLTPVDPRPDSLTDPPADPTLLPAVAAATVVDIASADSPTFTAFSDSVPTALPVQDPQNIRHTASAPISLELFGMEEQPDEPIELVATAFQSLPPSTPTLQLSADMVAGSSLNVAAFAPSVNNLPSNSADVNEPADLAADYWLVLTKLMQACTQELQTGQQVWRQVIATDAQEAFQADVQGAAYLQSLQQIFRVALLLQHAASLYMDGTSAHAAFAAACQEGLTAVQGPNDAAAPDTTLSRTLDADGIQQEVRAATEQQEALQQEQADSSSSEHNLTSRLQWREGLCGLSLLPLDLLQLPLTATPSGQPCLAPLKALWINRVSQEAPSFVL